MSLQYVVFNDQDICSIYLLRACGSYCKGILHKGYIPYTEYATQYIVSIFWKIVNKLGLKQSPRYKIK